MGIFVVLRFYLSPDLTFGGVGMALLLINQARGLRKTGCTHAVIVVVVVVALTLTLERRMTSYDTATASKRTTFLGPVRQNERSP